jgi:glycosyltransferase involved in cell wall biosynthesis
MASFEHKLSAGLLKRGIQVTYSVQDSAFDVILIIGGTRDLVGLRRAKRKGIPIVQRLNGMNWIHKVRRTGIRHYLRAEYGNLILTYIRERIADRIVYQSEFAKGWWDRVRGFIAAPSWVIFNGVNLSEFTPQGEHDRPLDVYRMLMVEGNVGGGYEFGLETGYELISRINDNLDKPVELMVVGSVDKSVFEKWKNIEDNRLCLIGQVPHKDIPRIDRSAHVLYSADLNAACPNSVVEALACGLPVVGFNTGALSELVSERAGKIISYGGDPWKLDPPDVEGLARSTREVLHSQDNYREVARANAEIAFDLEKMVDAYLVALAE